MAKNGQLHLNRCRGNAGKIALIGHGRDTLRQHHDLARAALPPAPRDVNISQPLGTLQDMSAGFRMRPFDATQNL